MPAAPPIQFFRYGTTAHPTPRPENPRAPGAASLTTSVEWPLGGGAPSIAGGGADGGAVTSQSLQRFDEINNRRAQRAARRGNTSASAEGRAAVLADLPTATPLPLPGGAGAGVGASADSAAAAAAAPAAEEAESVGASLKLSTDSAARAARKAAAAARRQKLQVAASVG